MKNQKQTYKTPTDKKENLNSKDKYNIILQLYKGLTDNLEILGKKITDKKSTTEVSQVAYKVDKIASGLQYTLDFENEKTTSFDCPQSSCLTKYQKILGKAH